MTVVDDPTNADPIELEHRVATVNAVTFNIPKGCEEASCPRRATQVIVFTSDDEALPTRAKFLCRGHMKKLVNELQAQPGAHPKGEN